jgi:uncharacterized protein (TIGR02147 family)
MSIFDFEDYKQFMLAWISARPKNGRGESGRLAKFLRLHSTMMSHILRGNSQLSLEQAIEVANYMTLSDLETDYFLELVQFERSGTVMLKKKVKMRAEEIKKRALRLTERMNSQKHKLTESDLAIFYSSWHFSAIRLLATLAPIDTYEIGKKLNLSSKKANEAVTFLNRTGLCHTVEGSKIQASSSVTHLGADSPFVWKHHENWRLKALERHFDLKDEELVYSAPLTISQNDMVVLREKIVKLIQDFKKTVQNTHPEIVACLNVDWFRVDQSQKI